jgi:hypothetical protein
MPKPKRKKTPLLEKKSKAAWLLLKQKVIELHNEGHCMASISRTMHLHDSTIRRWLRAAGAPPKTSRGEPNRKLEMPDDEFDEEEVGPFSEIPMEASGDQGLDTLHQMAMQAALNGQIGAQAAQQLGTAEQHQAFIAYHAMRLIQQGLPHIRVPRTIMEVDKLDQMVRRAMGLDGKSGGSGAHRLRIDLKILGSADPAGMVGHRRAGTNLVVDAEVSGFEDGLSEDEDEDEDQ